MVAAFDVMFDWGGSDNSPGTSTDVDALGPPCIRFKVADDATIDSSDPIPIPAEGTGYSYWKHIYLKCSTAPSVQVDNVEFYTDGDGFGTGITLNVGDETPTHNSGDTTGYDVADAAEIMTEHTDITGVTDAFTYTSGSAKAVSISESGSVIDAENETTDYIVLQLAVASNATQGNLGDETLTFVYDEI